PSGDDLATASAATIVLAPGLFSTTTGCPQGAASLSASWRARMSMPPPGGQATTMRTGLAGQGSASAAKQHSESKLPRLNFMAARWYLRLHVPQHEAARPAQPQRVRRH